MKFNKHLLAFSLLLTVLSSCKKNNNNEDPSPYPPLSESSISAKMDGNLIEFTGQATKSSNSDGTYLGVKGYAVNGFRSAFIGLDILAKNITTGTYANVTDPKLSKMGSSIVYTPNFAAQPPYDSYASANAGGNGDVTITAISDKSVEGTFKGTLRLVDANGDATGKIMTVTDGKFKVPITTSK